MDQDLTCHDCGSGIETGFSFCPKCGAKQDQTCAQCGTACAPDFAFCPKCGHGLGAATVTTAPEAEAPKPVSRPGVDREADRRPVTVIFADLSGFTALSERLDPEDVRALQDDLHRAIRDVVRDFDGFLEKFVGDAALAVFGAPIAHEDDPERALGAALALMAQTEALSARWEARVGRPLDLHIGVNTGPVVAGALGAEGDTAYAVTGDTVNTASRLQSAAGDGEILVGPTTYRLTQHLFSFEPVGEIEMKGKLAPLSVYRLAGERKVATSVRGLATFGLTAPLIGRDRELDQIVDAFDMTGAGRAQVVRVVGEAGAGKTRLIEEFLDRLEQDNRLSGVAVRRAACSSIGDPLGVQGPIR